MTTQPIQLSPLLEQGIVAAAALEDADRHLSSVERQAIVDLFRQENPSVELPSNLDDAFTQIIF